MLHSIRNVDLNFHQISNYITFLTSFSLNVSKEFRSYFSENWRRKECKKWQDYVKNLSYTENLHIFSLRKKEHNFCKFLLARKVKNEKEIYNTPEFLLIPNYIFSSCSPKKYHRLINVFCQSKNIYKFFKSPFILRQGVSICRIFFWKNRPLKTCFSRNLMLKKSVFRMKLIKFSKHS